MSPNEFYAQLREQMKARSISQLSRETGLTRVTVRRILNQEGYDTKISVLQRLYDAICSNKVQTKSEFPENERIDNIGRNGGEGLHYDSK